MNEFVFRMHSTGRGKPKQIPLEEVIVIWHKRQIDFLLIWGLLCSFWVLRHHVLCLMFTHQFSLSSHSNNIYIAGCCSVTLLEKHTLPALLHVPVLWNGEVLWHTTANSRTWLVHVHLKRYETISFMYLDLCTSVTTKMNLTRHAKIPPTGKYSFSDS